MVIIRSSRYHNCAILVSQVSIASNGFLRYHGCAIFNTSSLRGTYGIDLARSEGNMTAYMTFLYDNIDILHFNDHVYIM